LALVMSVAEMLKTTETAAVSHVALGDVDRVIHEGTLTSPKPFSSVNNVRCVLAAVCTLISFYFESAEPLTSEERLFPAPRLSVVLGGMRHPRTATLVSLDAFL